MRRFFSQFSTLEWIASLALIVLLGGLAYLPLSGQMGFYYNDWYLITSKVSQMPLTEMFYLDRPRLGNLYNVSYAILGDNPVAWQWFTWLGRLAGTVAFFWLTRLLWPRQRLASTAMAALFFVYPGFLQQPIALTFSNHMIGYALGLFSLVFSVLAVQQTTWPRRIPWIGLALFSELIYLFIYEYMIGLEVVRVILIAFVLHRQKPLPVVRQALRTLQHWWVYLIPMSGFLYWRLFMFKSQRGTTNIDSLLDTYQSQAARMLTRLALESLRDFFEAVYLAWGVPFNRVVVSATFRDFVSGLVLAGVGVGLFFLYRAWLRRRESPTVESAEPERWPLEAIVLGTLFTLITLFPVVLSNRHIQYKDLMDRYTLHTTIGVTMLVVGLIYALVRPRWRSAAVAVLIGVAIVTHYNNAVFYKTMWDSQKQVWWQLSWRAPGLKPGTTLVPLLPDAYQLQESFEIWAPGNLIYQNQRGDLLVSGEVLNRDTAPIMRRGERVQRWVRTIPFINDYQQMLLASLPRPGACVHFLDGQQPELSLGDAPTVREVAPRSNVETIDLAAVQRIPPRQPFGPEPEHTWCYFYQKASLARQQGDWETVGRLGDEAQAAGYSPNDPVEWMPFLEGYLNLGQDDQAAGLMAIVRDNEAQRRLLCDTLTESTGAYSSPDIYAQLVTGLCPVAP